MKRLNVNMVEDSGTFAIILKCLLQQNNMTQGELAEATGMSCATISHYARGKSTPSQGNLEKIAKCLNVSPYMFYGDIDNLYPYTSSVSSIFPIRLNEMIREKGITQEELAKAIGVSRQSVNYYINGRQLPTSDVIKAISEYFDKPIDFFINVKMDNIVKTTKFYVNSMPSKSMECPFMKCELSFNEFECKCGGTCDLKDGVCSYLTTMEEKHE